ncbi:MAG: SGNH/GDSL hydrolase family protein [Romboutsia timonensis]
MTNIYELKDIGGNKIYPSTHEKAVKCSDGQTLDVKLESIGSPTDEQISTAVSNYLSENPVDGSVDTLIDTIPNNNLFDADNIVTSFETSDGTVVNGTFTNYIKLEQGQKYVTNLNYTQFHFFDADKNHTITTTYLSNPQILEGNGGYVLVKLPSDYSNTIFLEGTDIDAYRPQHIKLKSSLEDNKWYSKKWLCIGDSISTDEASLAKNGYAKLISRELGMTLTNISVSGKTMAWGYEQLDSMMDNFDLVTVMLGTNNQGYNCGMGSLNDEYYTAGEYNSNNSFYAQTQLMVEKLKTKFPKSVIMFLTPIKRTGCGDDASYNDENGYLNKLYTTKEYRDAVIDICNYYSLPYVDLYNCIDPRTEENRILYFMNASDGTHPNDLGHALFLAPPIKDAIVKQCPYYFNDWETIKDGEETTDTYGDIVVSNSTLTIDEGSSSTFAVTLSQAPTNNQIVNIASNNTDVTVSPTLLTFTSDDYSTAQTVTVSCAEDDDTTNDTATITLSSKNVSDVTVTITVTDNDEETITTTYTVTNNLTNVTNSNSVTSIEKNTSYTATLTAKDGYTLDTPTITMGGTNITSTVYADGTITIDAVTGDIVITASATQSSSGGDETEYAAIHTYGALSNLTDIDYDGTTYGTLVDSTNGLNLVPNIVYGNSSTSNLTCDRVSHVGNWVLERGSSFSIKIKGFQRKSNYFSQLSLMHTGCIGGLNLSVGEYISVQGRFVLGIFSATNLSFGDGVIGLIYYADDSSTQTTVKGTASFNNNETHDVLLTYDSVNHIVKIYQDTEESLSLEADLNIDGINLYANNNYYFDFDSIEVYDEVISNT